MGLFLTLRPWTLHTIPHTRLPFRPLPLQGRRLAVGDQLRTVVRTSRLLCCGIGTSSCRETYLFSASKGGEQLTNIKRKRIMLVH